MLVLNYLSIHMDNFVFPELEKTTKSYSGQFRIFRILISPKETIGKVLLFPGVLIFNFSGFTGICIVSPLYTTNIFTSPLAWLIESEFGERLSRSVFNSLGLPDCAAIYTHSPSKDVLTAFSTISAIASAILLTSAV